MNIDWLPALTVTLDPLASEAVELKASVPPR